MLWVTLLFSFVFPFSGNIFKLSDRIGFSSAQTAVKIFETGTFLPNANGHFLKEVGVEYFRPSLSCSVASQQEGKCID